MLRDYQFLAHRIGLLHRKEPASPMAVVGSRRGMAAPSPVRQKFPHIPDGNAATQRTGKECQEQAWLERW
jgi:hypothetical protein